MNIIEFIKKHEKFVDKAYYCPSGVLTIGYGTTVGVKKNDTMTEEQATQRLIKDATNIYVTLKYTYRDLLKPCQYDALVSFIYNIGWGNFKSSTMLKLLKHKEIELMSDQFGRWVYGTDPVTKQKIKLNGLVKRRAQEKAIFLGENYTPYKWI